MKPQTKSLWQNIVQSSTHQSPRTDLINSLLQMIILLDDAIFLSYVSAGVQQNNLFERRSWQTVVGKQNILLSMNTIQIILVPRLSGDQYPAIAIQIPSECLFTTTFIYYYSKPFSP